MKLRNKISKEIWNIPEWRTPAVQEGDISFFAELNGDGKLFSYKSITELNEEWEDVEPAEPLIKDEKIRKAVRAWAEASDVGVVQVAPFGVFDIESSARIYFYSRVIEDKDFYADKSYTIAELCGEIDCEPYKLPEGWY